jgi:hypothetical protein
MMQPQPATVIENLARYFPFKQKRDEKYFDDPSNVLSPDLKTV